MTPTLGPYQRHYNAAFRRYKNEDKAVEMVNSTIAKVWNKRTTMPEADFPRFLMHCLINEMNSKPKVKVPVVMYLEDAPKPSDAPVDAATDDWHHALASYNPGYGAMEVQDLAIRLLGGLTKAERERWLEFAECGTMRDLDLGGSSAKERKSFKTSIVTARLKLRQAYERHT